MQTSAYFKFQARAAELRAEIAELRKDERKLRKLGLDTAQLDSALLGLAAHARDLSDTLRASEPEVVKLIAASRGEEA